MPTDGAHGLRDVRETVRRYLRERPDAADTPAGIAQWWLPPEMRGISMLRLRQVLAELIEAGEMRRTVLPDGSELYARAADEPPAKDEQ